METSWECVGKGLNSKRGRINHEHSSDGSENFQETGAEQCQWRRRRRRRRAGLFTTSISDGQVMGDASKDNQSWGMKGSSCRWTKKQSVPVHIKSSDDDMHTFRVRLSKLLKFEDPHETKVAKEWNKPGSDRVAFGPEDWIQHRSGKRHCKNLMSMFTSKELMGIRRPVFGSTLFAVVIALYNSLVDRKLISGPHVQSSPMSLQLTSIALGLLLVFRTNAAYARIDDGRKLWSLLLARIRDFTRQIVMWVDEEGDRQSKASVLSYAATFAVAMKYHLLAEEHPQSEMCDLLPEKEVRDIMKSRHPPVFILQVIAQLTASCAKSETREALLDHNLSRLNESLGHCERIFTTPIPLAYTRLTSDFLLFWHFVLPICLWSLCLWAIVPVSFLSAVILFLIEEVSVHIEEPFHLLALDYICDSVKSSILDIVRARNYYVTRYVKEFLDARPSVYVKPRSESPSTTVTAFADADVDQLSGVSAEPESGTKPLTQTPLILDSNTTNDLDSGNLPKVEPLDPSPLQSAPSPMATSP